MKFSAQEEYGLRCLLLIAREGREGSLTIRDISFDEGLSSAYVAKLLRILRQAGLVKSSRGQIGGYTLARPASKITVAEVIAALGGRLFESDFCEDHTGIEVICTRSVDCSIRSLWQAVQTVVDGVLSKTTVADLLRSERDTTALVTHLVQIAESSSPNPPHPSSSLLEPQK